MNIQGIKRGKNILKHFEKKNYGFTLVELIIVITILAILAAIAFISFKNYSGNARDGNRVTTLKNIETGLDLYFVKTGNYPQPEGNLLPGSMSGTQIMISGEIGENITQAIGLNHLALDPTIGENYKYGITSNAQEFNLGGVGESDSVAQNIILTTYANTYYGQVVGNYKGYIKYSTGSSYYITNIPSLIYTYNGNVGDIYNEKENVYFVVKKGSNIPYEISGNANSQHPDDVIKEKTGKENAKFENINITSIINATSETEKKDKIQELIGANTDILDSFGSENEEIFETIINGEVPKGNSQSSSSSSSSGGGGDLTCPTNFHTEDNQTCVSDIKSLACEGTNPGATAALLGTENTNITWNGTAWSATPNWTHSTGTPGSCEYQCKAGYYFNNTTCIPASAGHYVANVGATSQTACPYGQTSLAGATECYNLFFQELCSRNGQLMYTDALGAYIGRVNSTGANEGGNPENLSVSGHIVVCTGNQTGYVLKSANEGASTVGGYTQTVGQELDGSYGNYYQFGKSDTSWVNGNADYDNDWKSPGGRDAGSANDWGVTHATATTATWANSTEANKLKMKGACPTGYHIPTNKEWTDVYNAAWSGENNGAYIGDALKLPLAGFRGGTTGIMNPTGDYGYYWSSSSMNSLASIVSFGSNFIESNNNTYRSDGLPIRCFKN